LLESSDVDGGSSVAVLTYVRVALETLDYPDIIDLILSYLMNIPENLEPTPPQQRAKRRQSLDLLSKAADIMDNPTPAIYSLADLIMTSLASRSQQTVATTLRLASTILRRHYPYSMHTLLKTLPVASSAPTRTIGAHNAEMEMLFQMVADLTGEGRDATQGYGDHLKDCQALLESHPCTTKFLGLRGSAGATGGGGGGGEDKLARMHIHTLSPHDPFLGLLVNLLSAFFSNTVETNLVLTCVIIDLAACAYMRPEGWLYFDPETYEFPDEADSDAEEEYELDEMADELAEILGETTLSETDDSFAERDRRRLREIKRARRQPDLSRSGIRPPPIIAALQDLVAQIAAYRKDIPDLDDKLMERRRAFEFTDEINDALQSSSKQQTTTTTTPNIYLDPFSPRSLVRPSVEKRESRSQFTSGEPRPRAISPAVDPAGPFGDHVADTTQRRIKVLMPGQKGLHMPPPPEDSASIKSSDTETPTRPVTRGSGAAAAAGEEFTLSHLLTNIMILQVCSRPGEVGGALRKLRKTDVVLLQEFILELAALTQVRASLFADVKFA
jgi:hypothetical protein